MAILQCNRVHWSLASGDDRRKGVGKQEHEAMCLPSLPAPCHVRLDHAHRLQSLEFACGLIRLEELAGLTYRLEELP